MGSSIAALAIGSILFLADAPLRASANAFLGALQTSVPAALELSNTPYTGAGLIGLVIRHQGAGGDQQGLHLPGFQPDHPGVVGNLITGFLIRRTTSWGFTHWVIEKWVATLTTFDQLRCD